MAVPKPAQDGRFGGGLNDVDEVFPYSGTTFGLENFTAQPQQGYHVKLTVASGWSAGWSEAQGVLAEVRPDAPTVVIPATVLIPASVVVPASVIVPATVVVNPTADNREPTDLPARRDAFP